MKIFHKFGAVIAGIVTGAISVMLIESISFLMYPMPDGLQIDDSEGMTQWISTLPVTAFLIVVIAWAAGSFVGTYVARRIAPRQQAIPGLIVWAFFMLATIYNLVTISHPFWMWPAGIGVCLVFGLMGFVFAAPKEFVVRTTRTIQAPVEKVFGTIARIEEFSEAIPGIKAIEFLTDRHYGVGTRFRETRLMNGREASTELEVTELEENNSIRMVSDAGGTIWDTVFTVVQAGSATEMKMQMDARPHKFMAELFTPMIIGMVGRAVEQDMDSVKDYCEKSS